MATKTNYDSFYRQWHKNPVHAAMHWAVFVVTAVLVTNGLITIIQVVTLS